ncbi:hypothetical protein GCM10012289_18570 [Nonomuraea cavernae]|uniref:Uncharacterized protein n=2 Tax=Nonomuraea cavernae TaxID=2045107 RepID=A0A917YSZ3_9ACTN|nr:hypothetical protein GCM10012289_18570 [Nonomuraea cavernae]
MGGFVLIQQAPPALFHSTWSIDSLLAGAVAAAAWLTYLLVRRGRPYAAARYGIEVRLQSELIAIDGTRRQLTIKDDTTGTDRVLSYDVDLGHSVGIHC